MRARTAGAAKENAEVKGQLAALEKIVGAEPFTPRYFRKLVREQMAESAFQFLYDTMNGDQTFQAVVITGVKGGGQQSQVVEVEAAGVVRVRAAEILIGTAVPKQAGLVDDDGNPQQGVVVLPPLDAEDSHGESHGGKEVIEEEVGLSTAQSEDRDEAPGQLEEVVPAALAQHVLAQRRARRAVGNGSKA